VHFLLYLVNFTQVAIF